MHLSLTPVTDLAPLAALLQANGLPADDLAEPGRRFWRAVTDDQRTIGFGGFEGTGRDLLLRSVVIDGHHRGKGWGRALAERLLQRAKAEGAARIWLLTIDAADFFRHLGFRTADRAAAPEVVATSRQFTTLCPASAQLLVKDL